MKAAERLLEVEGWTVTIDLGPATAAGKAGIFYASSNCVHRALNFIQY